MHAGALGFSTSPLGRGDPAGAATDAERLALAGVLGDLGTGVMQVSGGAPGGTKATRQLARELSAHAGRPTIYNLVTQPIERPDEWQEHLRWLEDVVQIGRPLLWLLRLRCCRPDLRPAPRARRAAGRGSDEPQQPVRRHADLGQGNGAALRRAHAGIPRSGCTEIAECRSGGGHRRAGAARHRPARPCARFFQPALGPCAGIHDAARAQPRARGQERHADRRDAGQERDGCLS